MRKHWIDNLRWVTVLLVLLYHVFYFYNNKGVLGGIGGFGEYPASPQYQDIIMYILYPWFMPLLFILAGISSRYALQKQSAREWFRSRTRKLLVPGTIGLFVFHWMVGYFNTVVAEREGVFDGVPAVAKFIIMAISGTGPLWFIQVLWLLCLVLLLLRAIDPKDRLCSACGKLFGGIRESRAAGYVQRETGINDGETGTRANNAAGDAQCENSGETSPGGGAAAGETSPDSSKAGKARDRKGIVRTIAIVLLGILFWLGEQTLIREPRPQSPDGLYNLYKPLFYLVPFLLGYYVFSHEAVQQKVARAWVPLLAGAVVAGAALIITTFGQDNTSPAYLQSPLNCLYGWLACLGMMGWFAARFDATSRFAGYMTSSSYGIYIVHYLVIASLGYMMKTYTQLPPAAMYLILAAAVFTLSPLLYEILRRIPFVRWCVFGQKAPRQ